MMNKVSLKNARVGIVSDPLTEFGGEQRVLEVLHEMFPAAPVYTGLLNPRNLPGRFDGWHFITPTNPIFGLLDKIPLRVLRLLLLFNYISLDLSQYAIVVSSGTLFAKFGGWRKGKPKRHLSYVHTPPRFLYGYETSSGVRQNCMLRLILLPLDHILRILDYKAARENVDTLMCNSKEVRRRIRKFYAREATVINPPVILPRLPVMGASVEDKEDYFLVVSRLEKYKNVDLAIKACNMIGSRLIIVGKGGMSKDLKLLAGPRVEFKGFVSDIELRTLYLKARAFIFPVKDEDFGITPIEAQSYGCPVIAHRSGGALETVIEGKTGEFFNDLSVQTLAKALKDFNPKRYSREDCINSASRFNKEKFGRKLESLLSL